MGLTGGNTAAALPQGQTVNVNALAAQTGLPASTVAALAQQVQAGGGSTLLQQISAGTPIGSLNVNTGPDATDIRRQQAGVASINAIVSAFKPAAGASTPFGNLDSTDVSFLQQVLAPLNGGSSSSIMGAAATAAAPNGLSSAISKTLSNPGLDADSKAFMSKILLAGSDAPGSSQFNAFGMLAGSSGQGRSAEDQAFINNIIGGTGLGQQTALTAADQAWIQGIMPTPKYTLAQIQARAQQVENQRQGIATTGTPAATPVATQPTAQTVANTYRQNTVPTTGTYTTPTTSTGTGVNVATRAGEYVPDTRIRIINGRLVRG